MSTSASRWLVDSADTKPQSSGRTTAGRSPVAAHRLRTSCATSPDLFTSVPFPVPADSNGDGASEREQALLAEQAVGASTLRWRCLSGRGVDVHSAPARTPARTIARRLMSEQQRVHARDGIRGVRSSCAGGHGAGGVTADTPIRLSLDTGVRRARRGHVTSNCRHGCHAGRRLHAVARLRLLLSVAAT
jgi:hypothetical protein